MDLEKIEIRKIFLKTPDFATLNHFIFIILWYQSSPSRSHAELLTIPWMKRCFEKMERPKSLTLSKKINLKKKIGGHLELRALAFNSGWSPIFLTPREIPFCVRYFKPKFVSDK